MNSRIASAILGLVPLLLSSPAAALDYAVGPGQAYAAVGDVPWESLLPGDRVLIHWRPQSYKEKWVIGRQGTQQNPIVVSGVPGPQGQLPVIDGRDATTRSQLNFWNEERGVIKIGGSNTPPDTTPRYIVIENLEIRSGRPPYTFTGRNGLTSYVNNCAALYVEKGEHLTFRNCVTHDCGNGIFAGPLSQDILIEYCSIYDNSMEGRFFEHNTYTECDRIVYQYNHFGPTRAGAGGNNLKDRSAGTVIRYNWIEGGNRQLDLVESVELDTLPHYRETFVYGNILIEPDGAGNSQIIHYGGDNGDENFYRKGTLYFYHNTLISTRSGNTTLLRLSSNDETADTRNNILYVTAGGSRLAMLDDTGVLHLRNNWTRPGWVNSHGGAISGAIFDDGGMISGNDPGFVNFNAQDFQLLDTSICRNSATALHPAAAAQPVALQYVPHQNWEARIDDGQPDLGAFEFFDATAIPPTTNAAGWVLY